MEFLHFPAMFLRSRRSNNSPEWEPQSIFDQLFPQTKTKLNEIMSQDKCSACSGVYHEATGHRHSENTILCGPCTRHYLKWLKGHTNRRWGGVRFYDYAFPPKENK